MLRGSIVDFGSFIWANCRSRPAWQLQATPWPNAKKARLAEVAEVEESIRTQQYEFFWKIVRFQTSTTWNSSVRMQKALLLSDRLQPWAQVCGQEALARGRLYDFPTFRRWLSDWNIWTNVRMFLLVSLVSYAESQSSDLFADTTQSEMSNDAQRSRHSVV